MLEAIDTVGLMIIQVSGRIAIESKQGVRPNKTVIGREQRLRPLAAG